MTRDELIERVRPALESRPDVRFALLFGSAATRGLDQARDVDVAVSFAGSPPLLDLGALASALEDAVGRELDLVDLATASTLLRWEVVRTGIPVMVRDRDAFLDFRARVPIEWEDLRPYFEMQSEGLRRALEEVEWSASPSSATKSAG